MNKYEYEDFEYELTRTILVLPVDRPATEKGDIILMLPLKRF